jgi:transcription-repair coupling factor (superfamily II helicase)
MYCRLLEREARRLRGETVLEATRTHMELGLGELGQAPRLPKSWIPSDRHRLGAYRRIAACEDLTALEAVGADLVAAWGQMPEEARQGLLLARVRLLGASLGVSTLLRDGGDLVFRMRPGANPAPLETRLQAAPGRAVRLDATSLHWRPPSAFVAGPALLAVLQRVLS